MEAMKNTGLIPLTLTPPNPATSMAPITGPMKPITPCARLSQQPIAVARSLFASEVPHTVAQPYPAAVDPHHQSIVPARANTQFWANPIIRYERATSATPAEYTFLVPTHATAVPAKRPSTALATIPALLIAPNWVPVAPSNAM